MNPLDDLLSSTGRVPGITPGGLGNGRAALDAAIGGASPQQNATMRQPGSRAGREAVSRWRGGVRGKTVIGIAVAAIAAAAGMTTVVLPSPSSHLEPAGAQIGGQIYTSSFRVMRP